MKKYLSILLLLSIFIPNTTLACIPAFPDPWFSLENLTLDEETIPQDLDISVNKAESWSYLVNKNKNLDPDYSFSVEIRNLKPEPFYSLSKDLYSNEQRHPKLSKGLYFRQKLESNHVYDIKRGNEDDPLEGWSAWELEKYGDGDKIILQYTPSNSIQVHGKNRPEDVIIPDPTTFTIYGYYKDEELQITGKKFYKLNDYYNPDRGWNGTDLDPCSFVSGYGLIFYGVIIVVFGLLIFGLYKFIRLIIRKIKEKNN